jgi:hypothetical protein
MTKENDLKELTLDEFIDIIGEPSNEHELATAILQYEDYKETHEHDKNS